MLSLRQEMTLSTVLKIAIPCSLVSSAASLGFEVPAPTAALAKSAVQEVDLVTVSLTDLDQAEAAEDIPPRFRPPIPAPIPPNPQADCDFGMTLAASAFFSSVPLTDEAPSAKSSSSSSEGLSENLPHKGKSLKSTGSQNFRCFAK